MDEKEKEKGWKKNWLPISLILVAFLAVLLFNGYGLLYNSKDSNSSNSNLNISPSNISNSNSNYTNNTDKDAYLKNRLSMNYEIIREDLKCIPEAANKQNFKTMEKCGKFLEDDTDRFLKEVGDFNSSLFSNISEDYIKSLKSYNAGAINLENGSRDRNESQMYLAYNYLQNGTAQGVKIWHILYGNSTQTKNS